MKKSGLEMIVIDKLLKIIKPKDNPKIGILKPGMKIALQQDRKTTITSKYA